MTCLVVESLGTLVLLILRDSAVCVFLLFLLWVAWYFCSSVQIMFMWW